MFVKVVETLPPPTIAPATEPSFASSLPSAVEASVVVKPFWLAPCSSTVNFAPAGRPSIFTDWPPLMVMVFVTVPDWSDALSM